MPPKKGGKKGKYALLMLLSEIVGQSGAFMARGAAWAWDKMFKVA